MGINTVAVLLNDFTHEFDGDGPLGKRIAHAMMTWNHGSNRPGDLKGYFHAGRVISAAHADYEQVVIIGKNTGCTVYDAKDLSYLALDSMAQCLKRHGWSAKPPAKAKRK